MDSFSNVRSGLLVLEGLELDGFDGHDAGPWARQDNGYNRWGLKKKKRWI